MAGRLVYQELGRPPPLLFERPIDAACFAEGLVPLLATIRSDLSSVYQRTGIPLSHVTANDLPQIKSTITADSLGGAKQIVVNIRRAYSCQVATAAVQKWEAGKPKPGKAVRVKGKLIPGKAAPYRPKPAVPSYCSGQQGAPA